MPAEETVPVAIYGNGHCHRAELYQEEMEKRGVKHVLYDIDSDENARLGLESHYDDGVAKAPAIVIAGTLYRNPSMRHLDKFLAHEGVYDPGLVHDEKQQRYIRHMAPVGAFVSYARRGNKMVLTHIEVSTELRGTGIGGRFAREVLAEIVEKDIPASITCTFLRKVAASNPEWADYFNI